MKSKFNELYEKIINESSSLFDLDNQDPYYKLNILDPDTKKVKRFQGDKFEIVNIFEELYKDKSISEKCIATIKYMDEETGGKFEFWSDETDENAVKSKWPKLIKNFKEQAGEKFSEKF